MNRFLKLIAGLLLLPAAVALTRTFVMTFDGGITLENMDRNTLWFIGGFIVWLILFAIYPRPIRTYVLAHELTHALWGLLMGAKVSKLRVSKKGGSVTLSKTNVLITLAPYFFPFYAFLALAAYLIIHAFFDTTAYQPFWYALFGLTWSFHLTFTLITLQVHQPDIHEHGRIFSYVLIYCINLATAALLLHLLTNRPLSNLGAAFRSDLIMTYRACGEFAAPVIDTARSRW